MSGDTASQSGDPPVDDGLARRAVVETTHGNDATAATVAAALAPDNTDDVQSTVNGSAVTTRIERGTTGSLLASVDDYLVNLGVADDVAATGREAEGDTGQTAQTDDDTGQTVRKDGDTTGSNTTHRDTADATDASAGNDADGLRDRRDTANDADTHDT